MVEQILLALILQTIFFILYNKFGSKVSAIIQRKICPVCFAVSSSWLALLVLKYSGIYPINSYLIAILLAESVAGVSSLAEEFLTIHPEYTLAPPSLKFAIVMYGTLAVSVFAFVQEFLGLMLFTPVIVFGFFALTLIQKPNKPREQNSSMLESKLKNCC